jgi:hypothetical protein
MTEKLLKLQEKIYNYYAKIDKEHEREFDPLYCPRVYFCKMGEFYEIAYYGQGWDEEPGTKAENIDYETRVFTYRYANFSCQAAKMSGFVSEHHKRIVKSTLSCSLKRSGFVA